MVVFPWLAGLRRGWFVFAAVLSVFMLRGGFGASTGGWGAVGGWVVGLGRCGLAPRTVRVGAWTVRGGGLDVGGGGVVVGGRGMIEGGRGVRRGGDGEWKVSMWGESVWYVTSVSDRVY